MKCCGYLSLGCSLKHQQRQTMNFTDLRVYQDALVIGELVWDIVTGWNRNAQNTVGNQFIRAADSIAANISEGFGRFHYKDNLRFCYYARGSLYESMTWITKAAKRGLLTETESAELDRMTSRLGIALNRYIASIKRADKNSRKRRDND